MHTRINVFCSAPTRYSLVEILEEKGFTCTGKSITDSYIHINSDFYSYHPFREVRGLKFVHFDKKHLDALRLVPKEAVNEFIVEVAR